MGNGLDEHLRLCRVDVDNQLAEVIEQVQRAGRALLVEREAADEADLSDSEINGLRLRAMVAEKRERALERVLGQLGWSYCHGHAVLHIHNGEGCPECRGCR
jgi:hypothetical protein